MFYIYAEFGRLRACLGMEYGYATASREAQYWTLKYQYCTMVVSDVSLPTNATEADILVAA